MYNTLALLTYSMEQSPSWEADRFLASQEIPRILWNMRAHYRMLCQLAAPGLEWLATSVLVLIYWYTMMHGQQTIKFYQNLKLTQL
jgi:hypothetical protein